jgi:plastocyanin
MQAIFGLRWRRGAGVAVAALALTVTLLAVCLAPAASRDKTQPRRGGAARVEIEDFAYRPPTLRVRRGTKVVFVNRDSTAHTATKRGSFDTGRIRRGGRATVRFKRRGVYRYICTIHPFMHGKIVVR